MPQNPIGISFLPSADQAVQGPRQGNLEGDLGAALKILSLRLPRVLGARAISSPELLQSPGGGGAPGFNPMAAVIQALLAAGGAGAGGGWGSGQGPGIGGALTPRIIPHQPGVGGPVTPNVPDIPNEFPHDPTLDQMPTLDRSVPQPGNRIPGDIRRRGPWQPY